MKDILLYRGAEAENYETVFEKLPAVYKKRVAKAYRDLALDTRIRFERLQTEVLLLHAAKNAGVRTPIILGLDKKNAGFWMERVAGKQLKQKISVKDCQAAGKMAGKLHANGIVHGDLTTSNFLVSNAGEVVLIDFGLGFRSPKTEDFAVDLLNFKKTFEATHPSQKKEWQAVLSGYRSGFKKASAVLAQMQRVQERARYL